VEVASSSSQLVVVFHPVELEEMLLVVPVVVYVVVTGAEVDTAASVVLLDSVSLQSSVLVTYAVEELLAGTLHEVDECSSSVQLVELCHGAVVVVLLAALDMVVYTGYPVSSSSHEVVVDGTSEELDWLTTLTGAGTVELTSRGALVYDGAAVPVPDG
jgi:hypothetical protein